MKSVGTHQKYAMILFLWLIFKANHNNLADYRQSLRKSVGTQLNSANDTNFFVIL